MCVGSSGLTPSLLKNLRNPLIAFRPVTGSFPIKFEIVMSTDELNCLNEPYFLKINLELSKLVGRAFSP